MKCYIFTNLIITFLILTFILDTTNCFKKSNTKFELYEPYNVLYPNTTYNELSDYGFASGECRNDYNCFLPYGICLNSTTCMCMPDYAQINTNKQLKQLSCSYKRKKVVIAALLELFLPLGLGHFYVGHFFLGSIKFFYNFTLYLFCCFLYYKGTNNEVLSNMITMCVILSCIIPAWNIIDLFLFFTNYYTDGYGIPLA